MTTHKHDYRIEVKRDAAKNVAVIKGELSAKEFTEAVKATIEGFRSEAEIPGFRKGAAPEKMIREKLGMEAILAEAAESALAHLYPHILEDEKIDAIGRPQVELTKLAEGNPLGFTLTVATMPKIKSFDYKKIASAKNGEKTVTEEISDKDVEDVVKQVKEAHLKKEARQGEPYDEKAVASLELTDDLVKIFGDFTSVADFKAKIKENLGKEKEHRTKEKRRITLFDSLIEAAEVNVPQILIEAEQERMLSQFRNDVERMGVTWADYVKHVKKTEDEMRKDWEKDAAKRAALEMILDHIAKEEKVTPEEKRVEVEVGHLLSHYKDLDHEQAKRYVEGIMVREAVIEFLEKVK